MHKNAISPIHWKIDKKWIVPSIGKLELLYLETQFADYNFATYYTTTNQPLQESEQKSNTCKKSSLPTPAPVHYETSSDDASSVSMSSDIDMKQFCRAIDLPGFEDNISPGNKMIAVIQICIKDAGIIFDRASGSVDKSYLYIGATNINFDVGIMEHGPAIQAGVETIKLMDRQAGVDLLSLTPFPGQKQVTRM